MITLRKKGETYNGAKGDYLITKGHIDKYELYINEDYLQKQEDGNLHLIFKFIQAFQFKKDAFKRIEEIEWEYIHSEEHAKSQLESGLMTLEQYNSIFK